MKSRKTRCSRLIGVRERIKGRKETGAGGREDVCVPLERASAKDEGRFRRPPGKAGIGSCCLDEYEQQRTDRLERV